MEDRDYLTVQFETLRDEIKATKARLFWVLAMGIFGVPLVTAVVHFLGGRLTDSTGRYIVLLVPYLVLVIIIMWIAEQNALMRAGRYIREQVEPKMGLSEPWEGWLESRPELRNMDRHLFACFTLVFFVYYFLTIGLAMVYLLGESAREPARQWWVYLTLVTYGIGAIWAIFTLLAHWRSCTRTSAR